MDHNLLNEQRISFANFLARLANGTNGPLEWEQFIVRHYDDPLLEEIRRQTVELSISRDGGKEWSNSEIEILQFMFRTLRQASTS
jgi:hypothetical protein